MWCGWRQAKCEALPKSEVPPVYRSRFASFALLHKVKHACRPPFTTRERVARGPTAHSRQPATHQRDGAGAGGLIHSVAFLHEYVGCVSIWRILTMWKKNLFVAGRGYVHVASAFPSLHTSRSVEIGSFRLSPIQHAGWERGRQLLDAGAC